MSSDIIQETIGECEYIVRVCVLCLFPLCYNKSLPKGVSEVNLPWDQIF